MDRPSHQEKRKIYSRTYRDAHKEEIAAYNGAYREAHREEQKAYMKAWRKAHQEEQRAYREAHQQKRKADDKAYCETHREERRMRHRVYNEAHREERRLYRQKYRQTDRSRAVRRQGTARRGAQKAGLPATLTEEQWLRTLAYFDNCCTYCGLRNTPLEQDHIVPLSMGGAYVANNIVPACKRCNSSKNNMPLQEWVADRGAAFVQEGAVKQIQAYLALQT